MLQGEHSAILSTFIKLLFVIKIFVLSIFEWPFKSGFTVLLSHDELVHMIIKGSEPREPTVSTQTILEMGYSRDSLTDAMKKAEAKGELLLLPSLVYDYER